MIKTPMKLIVLLVFLSINNVMFSQKKVLFHKYIPTASSWNIEQWNISDTTNVTYALKEVVDNQGRVIELIFLENGKEIDGGLCYLATRVEYEYQDKKIITRLYIADEPMLATECEMNYMSISHLDKDGYIEKRENFFAFDFSDMDSASIEEIKKYIPEHNVVIPNTIHSEWGIDFIMLDIDYYSLSYAKMNGIYPISKNYVIKEGDYYYRDEHELEKASIINGIEKLKKMFSDTLVPVPKLEAFTHPQFFFYGDCGMFNPDYFQLKIYNMPTESNIPYGRANSYIIPPNYEAGYPVTITGTQGDFFSIKFGEDFGYSHPICYNCADTTYYVKKGTLGTWVDNFDGENYLDVPLYEKSDTSSKVITKLKSEDDVVVLILDISENWMYVETFSDKEKRRGWLDPKMQFGDPHGAFY